MMNVGNIFILSVLTMTILYEKVGEPRRHTFATLLVS